MKRTRYIVLLLSAALLIALCLSGCSLLKSNLMDRITSEDGALVTDQSNEIIRCLTEKDREGFCALFSEQARQSDTFEQEVDALFDFFRCDAYIRAGFDDLAGGGGSMESGDRTEWYLHPEITYIEVLQDADDGSENVVDRYYGANYLWQVTDEEHPERVGLNYFEIYLLNTDEIVTIGVFE